jgi:hypothetical protein
MICRTNFTNSRRKLLKSKTFPTSSWMHLIGAVRAAAPQAVQAAAPQAVVVAVTRVQALQAVTDLCENDEHTSLEREKPMSHRRLTMLLNDLEKDLQDELHQLETETFEIEDIADIEIEAASCGCSSSCSTSSCCSCSTSSCCSCSTSCNSC